MLRRLARLLGFSHDDVEVTSSNRPPCSPAPSATPSCQPVTNCEAGDLREGCPSLAAPDRLIEPQTPDLASVVVACGQSERTFHAPILARVPLRKLGLFGSSWRERLAQLGISTAEQFLQQSPAAWRQAGMSETEVRKLRRWQKAVALAAEMPAMKPYEAMMLFAIHRRRQARLASERPGRLHRDLTRFALSTPGQRLLRHRDVPDRQRVESWIDAARREIRLPVATD